MRPVTGGDSAAKASAGHGSTRFRPDIQGLRALAVLAVIADHLFGYPLGGFVGVDVFFVISGFLITGIVLREYERTGHISFLAFYRRRIRRILPLATLVILVTVLASFALLSRGRADSVLGDGFWAFVFTANWNMAFVGTDYFQLGLPPSPLQHYWSLSVEEQFYFVWPWLLLGVLMVAGRLRWQVGAKRVAVFALFALATVGSFAWSVHETSANPNLAYFSTLSRAWELGAGAMVAAIAVYLHRLPSWSRPILGWAGFLGIIATLFTVTSETPFPGPGALLPVLSTVLVIVAGTGDMGTFHTRALFPLTNRVSSYLWDISYSLYLWHFPVIMLLLAVLPGDSPAYFALSLLGTFGLSVLSYHFVEDRIRKSRWLEPDPSRFTTRRGTRVVSGRERRPVIVGLGIFGLITVGFAVVAFALPMPVEPPKPPPGSSRTSGDAGPEPVPCFGAASLEASPQPCVNPDLSDVLAPTVDALPDDTAGAYECWREKGAGLRSCTSGSTERDALRVALVGDSHAAMLIPALKLQLKELNWQLETFVGYGCQWRVNPQSDCAATMGEVQQKLTDPAAPYDLVITTSARWTAGKDIEGAADDYAALWAPVAALGTKVVAVADTPAVSEEALQCISRVGLDPVANDCATPAAEAFALPDPLIEAVKRVPTASLVDMTDYFCSDGACPVIVGHVIAYRDTAGHITGTYGETLSPYLTDRIRRTLAG